MPTTDPTPIPEPHDGARIEFTHNTDVYGAWRDDASSIAAGWSPAAGWCVYGESVPLTWVEMVEHFGDSLRGLTVLVPEARGLAAGRTTAPDVQRVIPSPEETPR